MPICRRAPLLLCAPLLFPLPSFAAAPADFVPPPGLYRIDTDTSAAMKLGAIEGHGQIHEDGASGATRFSGVVDGVPKQSGSAKGGAPNTQCVRPVTGSTPLAGISTGAACVAKGGVVENGAFVIRQNCAQNKFEITIRKIDKSTWEYKTDVLQSGMPSAATAQSSESAVVAMLRNARAQARTEQERKDLDATLAEYASRSKEDKVAPPGMPSPATGGALQRHTVMLQKWTRIADRCDAPKT